MTRHEVTQIMHGLTSWDTPSTCSESKRLEYLIDVVNAILPLVKFPEDEEEDTEHSEYLPIEDTPLRLGRSRSLWEF